MHPPYRPQFFIPQLLVIRVTLLALGNLTCVSPMLLIP